MGYFSRGIIKITAFLFITYFVTIVLIQLSPVVFPDIPKDSADIDCDDVTLGMYRHFQRLGAEEATPILGNLEMESELYSDCNHVWLLVKSGDNVIAYDWCEPRFDKQHYEGYPINLDCLLSAVGNDLSNSEPR